MKKIYSLKEELKSLAQIIRKANHIIKTEAPKRYVGGEQSYRLRLRDNFRYRHVAYCMLRGKTFSQIENNKVFTNAFIDVKRVEQIMEAYREEDVCIMSK